MPAPLIASLTDPIVQFAVDVVDAMGLPGIFLLMVAESACIPIPSETTFLFAGFNVSRGEYSLFAVVATGTLANVDQAVMILKMLRPKTAVQRPSQRAKQRITSLTLPRVEPPGKPA